MATKVKATKTLNPLHFEDLEPHRFEDLVRRLLYTFRDWNAIEPTGRAGSDEGFDIRAWERGDAVTNVSDDGDEGARLLEGRLWQVQGKREKAIPPAKMRTIIRDGVDGVNPPHGYILAAATNISKTSYDMFRAELRKKGVTELIFWGKDYLEDQLSLPQNDEILFTFFGISLSPRRRSRVTEVKFGINNKNKIIRMVFGSEELSVRRELQRKSFLLRDIKAEHYPDQAAYADFAEHRRWEEHAITEITPRGALFKFRERYGYFDPVAKAFDVSLAIDLIPRMHRLDRANEAALEDEGKTVERYWRHLPRRFQAKLIVYGFVPFEDILIIDDRGDLEYPYPHLFLDFGHNGPFQGTLGKLVHGHTVHWDFDALKKIDIFPSTFPELRRGAVHEMSALGFNPDEVQSLERIRGAATVYSFDDRLIALTLGSVIHIPKKDQGGIDNHAEVTCICETTVGAILAEQPSARWEIGRSVAGRELSDADSVHAYELHQVMLLPDGKGLYYLGENSGWDT